MNVIISNHCLASTFMMIPVVDFSIRAAGSWTRAIKVIHLFIIFQTRQKLLIIHNTFYVILFIYTFQLLLLRRKHNIKFGMWGKQKSRGKRHGHFSNSGSEVVQTYDQQSHNPGNRHLRSHGVVQQQKQLVDQNYANNIVFMGLSTVEEIVNKAQGAQRAKKFEKYDKADYSWKNLDEMKSQLQVHLMLLKTSKQCFDEEYGPRSYQLPSQFNEARVIDQLKKYEAILRDQWGDVALMVQDFAKIIQGDYHDLHFEKVSYTIEYPEKEKKQNEKALFRQGVDATQDMHREREKIQSLPENFSAENLPVQINQDAMDEENVGEQDTFQDKQTGKSKQRESNKQEEIKEFRKEERDEIDEEHTEDSKKGEAQKQKEMEESREEEMDEEHPETEKKEYPHSKKHQQ